MKRFTMKNIVEYRLEILYLEYSDSNTMIETHNNAEVLEVKAINGHLAIWLREDPKLNTIFGLWMCLLRINTPLREYQIDITMLG